MSKKVRRLFEQFHPEHYDLQLQPDPASMQFSGSVAIHGSKIGRPTNRLTFHGHGLKVLAAKVTKHEKTGDRIIKVSRVNTQATYDEIRVHSDEKLVPGDYSVELKFSGLITRQMEGIYPCFFTHDGQEKKLIATQFESHDARKAFPAIDEPEAKATFALTLITPLKAVVISNTPVKKQSHLRGDLQKTNFETTPRMSTYLLAFAFGELGYSEGTTKDGVTVRAYATPDNIALTHHGLGVAIKCLEFFSDYFKVPYPLPKLDMIALPDFSSGAMENWGLVTYRETTMLADDKTSSIETKQLVALVICHELSHQWFGNLVTMKWWNDLWLNESFANLMEHRAIDTLYPEWHIWELFVSTETASAKRRDSLIDVQPIRSEVNHPDEISTLFDPSIVYAKGGSVLYMLMNFIGEDAFRAGLGNYFAKHAYGNTTADDLWAALSASSQQNVGDFMSGWLNRPGYPLVDISWQPGEQHVSLKQKRFLSNPSVEEAATEPWQVPLNATVELDTPLLTAAASSTHVLGEVASALLFNHDGKSYYLPHYIEPDHLLQITAALKAGAVDPIDRLLLLDNYTMLQRGGIAKTTELLDLLGAYVDEQNENVWGAMAIAIGEIRKLIEADEAREAILNTLVAAQVQPTLERLGWDDRTGDDAQTLRMRGLALAIANGAQVKAVLDEGKRRFKTMKKPSDLSPTIRSAVYFAVVRYGTAADFKKLLRLHNTSLSADERDELAAGLSAAKKPAQYNELLELLTGKNVRRQDLLHWFVWLLRNRYSRTAAWEWMVGHWDWIEIELKGDKSYSYFARYAGGVFSRPDELSKYLDFFNSKRSDIALMRDISLGEQEIRNRIAWRERNQTSVTEWLTTPRSN